MSNMSNKCQALLRCSQNLDFLGLKTLPAGRFWGAQTHGDIIEF